MDESVSSAGTKWYWCAAEGCVSDDRKRKQYPYMKGITFHPFPTEKKNPKHRKKWLQLLRRENYNPSPKHRLCSLHFIDGRPTPEHPFPELFAYNNFRGTLSSNPPTSVRKLERSRKKLEAESQRRMNMDEETLTSSNRSIFNCMHLDDQSKTMCSNEVEVGTFVETMDIDLVVNDTLSKSVNPLSDHQYTYMYTDHENSSDVETHTADACCQTTLTGKDMDEKDLELTLLKQKLNDKQSLLRNTFYDVVLEDDVSVKKYTGIPTLSQLNGIFDVVNEAEPKVKYWSGQSTLQEVNYQKEEKEKTGPKRKLNKKQEYVLTLIKLRLGIVSFFLADIFGISDSRVSQIFSTWINLLYHVLLPCLKWPTRKKIKKHMPRSFRKTFPKTVSIIDCTEIFTKKPRGPTAQYRTYSQYKGQNTFKVLVSISPSGAFTFISDLWGGNTSDRYITEHSGYLDNISPGDEVMADRGFVIRDLLTERRATLVIPPFTRKCNWGKGKRLTAKEVANTKTIAKQRIHVERAIQRLKCFKMLSGVLDLKYKPLANQMVKLAGIFCNLDKPLVTN